MSEITIDHSAYECPALGEIKVGDVVFVIRARDGAVPIPARVAKVGRVWLDIESTYGTGGAFNGTVWRMRIDTQNENTGRGTGGAYFLTPAQLQWRELLRNALAFLREHEIYLNGGPWRADAAKIHLAELLKGAIEREADDR